MIIYIFIDRKIYGIGKAVAINGKVVHLNYPESIFPQPKTYGINNQSLIKDNDVRFVVTFKPFPLFFERGIDMDVALSSKPSAFRTLRAMWGVSFIKLNDEENSALFDIILRENKNYFFISEGLFHSSEKFKEIEKKLSLESYNFEVSDLLKQNSNKNKIKHEMTIEAYIVEQLSKGNLKSYFGK